MEPDSSIQLNTTDARGEDLNQARIEPEDNPLIDQDKVKDNTGKKKVFSRFWEQQYDKGQKSQGTTNPVKSNGSTSSKKDLDQLGFVYKPNDAKVKEFIDLYYYVDQLIVQREQQLMEMYSNGGNYAKYQGILQQLIKSRDFLREILGSDNVGISIPNRLDNYRLHRQGKNTKQDIQKRILGEGTPADDIEYIKKHSIADAAIALLNNMRASFVRPLKLFNLCTQYNQIMSQQKQIDAEELEEMCVDDQRYVKKLIDVSKKESGNKDYEDILRKLGSELVEMEEKVKNPDNYSLKKTYQQMFENHKVLTDYIAKMNFYADFQKQDDKTLQEAQCIFELKSLLPSDYNSNIPEFIKGFNIHAKISHIYHEFICILQDTNLFIRDCSSMNKCTYADKSKVIIEKISKFIDDAINMQQQGKEYDPFTEISTITDKCSNQNAITCKLDCKQCCKCMCQKVISAAGDLVLKQEKIEVDEEKPTLDLYKLRAEFSSKNDYQPLMQQISKYGGYGDSSVGKFKSLFKLDRINKSLTCITQQQVSFIHQMLNQFEVEIIQFRQSPDELTQLAFRAFEENTDPDIDDLSKQIEDLFEDNNKLSTTLYQQVHDHSLYKNYDKLRMGLDTKLGMYKQPAQPLVGVGQNKPQMSMTMFEIEGDQKMDTETIDMLRQLTGDFDLIN